MDSVLRPRDIQARIRSGETPEAVAAAAQTTVEKVMVFATPVLAERAWVAEQALKASVRRRVGSGPVGHLGEAVSARLSEEDLDPGSVDWDAWRQDDGRWTVIADFTADDGARRATFVYDAAGRYVVAEDEEARRLVGDRSTAGTPVMLDEDDAQTSLGDDAIELVTGRRPTLVAEGRVDEPSPGLPSEPAVEVVRPPAPPPTRDNERVVDLGAEPTVDLTESIRAARPLRPSVGAPEEWMTTQASERPDPPAASASAPDVSLFEAEEAERGAAVGEADQEAAPPAETESEAESRHQQPRKPPAKGRGKRASVPSWDEIMFGSGQGE